LKPTNLILEVTESLAFDEGEGATESLQPLREQGIRIALDDFGTGHSSLSRLRDFPVDIIKIDKAFTTTLRAARDGGGLSHAVFTFSHSLGVTVVAEGVEELGDLHALGDFPREWAQGYHLARPLDANAMLDLLDVRRFQMAPAAGARVIRLPLRSQAS
jgi:EAL domain-containing protein (putative c-di-GMP-specific phosphodiesterase class I)